MKDKARGFGSGIVSKYKIPEDILRKIKEGDTEAEAKYVREINKGNVEPYETTDPIQNSWFTAGWNHILDIVCGADTTNLFSNSLAQIGVGNASAAFSDAHTDLQGGSTSWKSMLSGYPNAASSGQVEMKAQWGTAHGNYSWEEWAVKENTTDVLWNRALTAPSGTEWTKDSTEIWDLTVTIGASA